MYSVIQNLVQNVIKHGVFGKFLKISLLNNCKIVIRITNTYKNRPFTKVVNDKKLFNQLFTLIVEG